MEVRDQHQQVRQHALEAACNAAHASDNELRQVALQLVRQDLTKRKSVVERVGLHLLSGHFKHVFFRHVELKCSDEDLQASVKRALVSQLLDFAVGQSPDALAQEGQQTRELVDLIPPTTHCSRAPVSGQQDSQGAEGAGGIARGQEHMAQLGSSAVPPVEQDERVGAEDQAQQVAD
eukprot:756749-Hanusia_phi.AAC.5